MDVDVDVDVDVNPSECGTKLSALPARPLTSDHKMSKVACDGPPSQGGACGKHLNARLTLEPSFSEIYTAALPTASSLPSSPPKQTHPSHLFTRDFSYSYHLVESLLKVNN